MHNIFAQQIKFDLPYGASNGAITTEIKGPLDDSLSTVGGVITRVLQFGVPILALILVGVFIWGGYDILTSGGDPTKVKSAQAKMTAGVIGFVLVIGAFFITRIIAQIFGFGKGIFF